MSEPSRRRFLASAVTAALPFKAAEAAPAGVAGRPLTVLHLTDIHIRPEHDAPKRCSEILREVRRRFPEIDLVVNTGDSIYAADYGNITRERMLEQWKIWDETVMTALKGLPVVHSIGNHDPWWAGAEEDEMRGIPYVCRRLGLKEPYSASSHGGWEVITLENCRGSMDEAQQKWLFAKLDALPDTVPVLLASHLPLFSLAGDYDGGNMKGAKAVVDKLAARKAPVVALSGHIHIQSSETLWNIKFHCNGALSGSWWEPGDAGDGSYKRTPAGYALLRLWPDGRSESNYLPLTA
ncbi:metallophosphoesterase [Haloferula sp. BvORR071]|uniref:metallophosphoesterase family protein n=1 Tax=Haloferula sp. BvORR071 TaxID=1396141 RepID=UPI0006984622|nr:metallophosphoesterase [Haloferula sp. BvORR071]